MALIQFDDLPVGATDIALLGLLYALVAMGRRWLR